MIIEMEHTLCFPYKTHLNPTEDKKSNCKTAWMVDTAKKNVLQVSGSYLLQGETRKWEASCGPYYNADPPASLPWGVAWQMSYVKEKAEQHKFSFAGLHRMGGYVCFPSFPSEIKLGSIYILLSLFRVKYC